MRGRDLDPRRPFTAPMWPTALLAIAAGAAGAAVLLVPLLWLWGH